MNVYSEKGIEFVSFIHSKCYKDSISRSTIKSLLAILDCLKVREGWQLGLRIAQPNGIGDESKYYIYRKEKSFCSFLCKADPYQNMGREDFVKAVENNEVHLHFNDLSIEPSEMGAWQTYLLVFSPTVLPTFWHGGYIMRTFIFSGCEKIKPFGSKKTEDSFSLNNYDTNPSVTKQDDGYLVSCCYWNDWRGLIRENVMITIKEGFFESVKKVNEEILYPFYCGIRF